MGSTEQNQKLPKLKVFWSYDLHKSFIDLCTDQMRANEKKGTFFSKKGWNFICDEFNKRNGKEFDKKQLKNHWEVTKSDWKIWYKLKEYETGLGWNPEKNTIVNNDDWWKDHLKKCPGANKFRYRGIEHADLLTDLFLEGMATGKLAWAPSEGSLPNDIGGPCRGSEKEHFVDLDSDPPKVEHVVEKNDDYSVSEKETQLNSRKRKVDIIPPEPRRRASSGATMIKELGKIGEMCEVVINRKASRPEPPVTINDCIVILDQMNEEVPNDSDLYLFACELFLNQQQRDMFKALKPDTRLRWIQKQENKENKK